MSLLSAALEHTAESSPFTTLETFRKHLDPTWVEEALAATGTASLRKRRLPAEQVIWLVIGMALMRDRPMPEVIAKLELVLPGAKGEDVAASAISKARQRVGEDPLAWLFERCAQQWAHASARTDAWRGLAVYAVDGTTLRVPDSMENRAYFGLADGGHRGPSGYPLVRLVTLLAVRSHLLAAAAFGPYTRSEKHYAGKLWAEVPGHSLVTVDRNFLSAPILWALQNGAQERHWLIRAKSNTQWRVLRKLGPHDHLVELKVSRQSRQQHPDLPGTIRARAIRYRHPGSKGEQWLLTSLLDSETYPAEELIALYHERWEIELSYDELKTHLLDGEVTLRSKRPDSARQEVWGVLLTYNLIRLEMERIARELDVPPTRISFMAAVRYIRDEWLWCTVASPGSIPSKLRRMRQRIAAHLLPPRRSHRRYPRAVKIKMSNYAKKRRPEQLQRQQRVVPPVA
jgi:hypothetical protein